MALDDESKKSPKSTGLDDGRRRRRRRCVVVANITTTTVGLPMTALRRHVPRDFGGPFQDGSLVVAMQDLSLFLFSSPLSFFLSAFPASILTFLLLGPRSVLRFSFR